MPAPPFVLATADGYPPLSPRNRVSRHGRTGYRHRMHLSPPPDLEIDPGPPPPAPTPQPPPQPDRPVTPPSVPDRPEQPPDPYPGPEPGEPPIKDPQIRTTSIFADRRR